MASPWSVTKIVLPIKRLFELLKSTQNTQYERLNDVALFQTKHSNDEKWMIEKGVLVLQDRYSINNHISLNIQ